MTTQVDFDAGATGRGTVTPEHRFKAEPNVIGRQLDGEITVISNRAASSSGLISESSQYWTKGSVAAPFDAFGSALTGTET